MQKLKAPVGEPARLGDRVRAYFHAGRGGRVRLATAWGVGTRISLALVGLVSLPISVRYLGNEGYGLMLAITSVVTWLQISTLGVGAGLQNALTEAVAKRDGEQERALLTTAVFSLAALAALLLVIGVALHPWVDWPRLFPSEARRFVDQIGLAFAAVFVFFCANMFLGFVPAVLAARQQLHVAFMGQLVAGFLGLAMLLLAVWMGWGLVGVAVAAIAPGAIVGLVFAIWILFIKPSRQERIGSDAFSIATLKRLVDRSVGFLVMYLTNIAFFQSDVFILTQLAGAESVTPYGVAQRVYLLVAGMFGIVTGSLWVAYGQARAAGDIAWIRRAYSRVRRMQALVTAVVIAGMVLGGEALLRLWVGPDAAPDTALIAALGAVFAAQQWTATHSMMLNGLDVVRSQMGCLVANGLLLIAFGIVGAYLFGAKGLAVGIVLSYLATSVWFLPLLVRRTLQRLEGKAA